MKKIGRFIFIGLIVFGMVFIFYYLYGKNKKQPVVFETKTAFVTDIVKKTVATGTIVPRKEIEIKPQVSGIIEKIYVEPGMSIKKGDLIAKVKIIPNMVSLNEAEARVNKAKINLEDAKEIYERQRKVYEEGVIPLADFQRYKVAYESAVAELEAAENNLQLIREGVNKKMGTSTNTLIRSTIDGMVLNVPVEEGNSVIESNNFNAGTTIAYVADMGEMIFKGKVDETEVGKLHEGMPIILTIGAIENEKFDATLEYISPKGVSENGAIQFEIKAKIHLKKGFFIRSGYSANADIVLDERKGVLAIPEKLLQFEGDSAFVEIETQPQIFVKRFVKTGLSDGINIQIIEGISEKDKIKVPL
ncbi:MAG: efflux RND transporter periplasmic adaptor subunit [Bacteroidales bacterium]|nr:efflux RND transporter periplasmic adaptor subunit [Bacteroidales bacterium]